MDWSPSCGINIRLYAEIRSRLYKSKWFSTVFIHSVCFIHSNWQYIWNWYIHILLFKNQLLYHCIYLTIFFFIKLFYSCHKLHIYHPSLLSALLMFSNQRDLWTNHWSLMTHRACCHTCYTIQLVHYSHFKTHTHFNI